MIHIPWLNKSNQHVEEKVCELLGSIQKDVKLSLIDIVHIMAWKMGKLKHKDVGEKDLFVYADEWKTEDEWRDLDKNPEKWLDLTVPTSKKSEKSNSDGKNKILEIGRLAKYLCERFDSLKEKAKKSPIHFIEDLMKEHIEGIGFVYAVTLLYFFSGGEYPIYDKCTLI